MSTPITVLAEPDVSSVAATVLASLPRSFTPGSTPEDGVVVVGGSAGWPAAAERALDAGAVSVIVVHPEPAEVESLESRNAPVFLDTRWAANPLVEVATEALAAALPSGSRLECRVHLAVGSRLQDALLDQIILVRALVGPVTDLRVLSRSAHGYAAEGVAAGHPVDLSLVCTDSVPESVSVRLLTGDGSIELFIPSGVTAQPARLTVTGPDGAQLSPTFYESGHRATWRRAHRALTDRQPAADLAGFTGDHNRASRAMAIAEG